MDVSATHRPRTAPSPDDSAARIAANLSAQLDELEKHGGYDVDDTLPRVVALEEAATAAGAERVRWQARLLRADLLDRRSDLADAVKLMWQAQAWAADNDCRPLLARAHMLLARTHLTMGDLSANLDHMLQAVDALDEGTGPAQHISYLVKLADAFADTGSMSEARKRYEQAERAAIGVDDISCRTMALNNYAYKECTLGDARRAQAVLERLREVSVASGWELDSSELDTFAHVRLRLGDYDAAEQMARQALARYATEKAESDAEAELLQTLATAQRCRGDLAAAQATLDESRRLCETHGLRLLAVRALQEQSELYAAARDFERAYATLHEYHLAEKDLRCEQREAQARNRQAVLEVQEARRQAETFRQQARHDPLTGLKNRRSVDERLPALLAQAQTDGTDVAVALLDLDHFKRVNDLRSHGTGDRVLVTVAELLENIPTGPSGFVARLGGEEFLVAITGTDLAGAAFRLEDLRRAVADHPWAQITGGLPVTVSVGVTAATAACTPATVLARADEALYTAKGEGRNRVCVGPSGPTLSQL
ncbi:diguanylate cyclase (GGDEF)-like protein [Krasilnikovia cinnamomea]|uniref:Diguanylate cyclase (GGDEF)-like protein n=1 Tax=Krasilnikovia cinnamomea TaxID=349313 RepID=A0A4Q7ZLH5_9ACTN|nr:tetratricopeptide repeat-containing diguanylate cyclase [Krasilnikovia cinnamomea]RZU51818.1 diguanylate cyclase (GGDEF)-like protein [Krasilnikovia cinnamomea]